PNTAVVTVNDQGVLLAQGEGTATVQASTPSGLQAVASVQVAKAPFAFASPILSAGPGIDTTIPVVVPTQGSRPVSVSSLNFQSSDTTVVKVSPLGRIHTVATGRAQVLAQGFFQTQALVVEVHPAITSVSVLPRTDRGDVIVPLAGVRPFKVALYTADSTELKNVPLAWSVKDTALAAFDGKSMTLRGKALGTTELTLLSPGPGIKPIVWPIKVVAGGLALTPKAIGIGIRDTSALTVAYTDSTGKPISPASPSDVKWTTSDSSVAAVSAGGVVTGIGFGHAKIVAATSWGKTDTTNLFVTGELIVASTRGGTQNLYTLDRAAPGTLGAVTHDSAIEAAPAFSPDGARIAFISTQDGNPEVYVSNADGTAPHRLTNTPQAEDGPVWTPDGKHIVFTSQRTGHFQIWIMNADGSDQRALTQEPATNFEPDVSPDGKSIAFTSTRDKHYDIYVMGLDGSNAHDVTKSDAADRHPRWFPDGELGYLVVQPGSSPQALAAMRLNLKTGQATTVSPTNLTLTNWAISPTGKVLALEVSALANGGVSKRVYFYTIGGTAAPLPIPQASPDEQQSGPAFRPRR
ncbi:MAG TPA: hypothetical protein VJ992_09230, partial [Gemmatimonadales bacterium]|nr:hypothetical protein [Gemmatimonadales bacterium]